MKTVAQLKKSLKYQHLKAIRLTLASAFISTSLILAACSGSDNETATKMSPDKPNPSKPTTPSNRHLAYDALGVLLNIGLFSIERATEIAIKESAATHLLTQENCQKAVAEAAGTNKTVQVTTTKANCGRAKNAATNWIGSETFKVGQSDGLMASLSSALSNYFQIETLSPQYLYSVKQRLNLTVSSASAADTVFDLNGSLIDIAVQIKDGSKIRHAQFAIQIFGMAQISQKTGKMTAVAIESADIFINREDKVANNSTTSTITLTPDVSGLTPLNCGQYVGRMNVSQRLNSTASRGEIQYNGAVIFSDETVSDIKDKKMTTPVAPCKPGFESIEQNLRTAGNKALNLLIAKKPEVTALETAMPDDDQVASE